MSNVFKDGNFIRQLEETKFKLKHHDSKLVEDVVKFHITKMAEELTKVRPWKRKILIYRWASIVVYPLCFNPYSLYYNDALTKRLLKKFKKELINLNQQQ